MCRKDPNPVQLCEETAGYDLGILTYTDLLQSCCISHLPNFHPSPYQWFKKTTTTTAKTILHTLPWQGTWVGCTVLRWGDCALDSFASSWFAQWQHPPGTAGRGTLAPLLTCSPLAGNDRYKQYMQSLSWRWILIRGRCRHYQTVWQISF